MKSNRLTLLFTVLVLSCMVAAARSSSAQSREDSKAQTDSKVFRHDPFESMVSRDQFKSVNRGDAPGGIPGLVIGSLKLNGIVKSSRGLIAIVENPSGRTYFLRDGALLYDGRVEKVSVDGVSFIEVVRDAFGKSAERQVNKRIYSSAGEQQ